MQEYVTIVLSLVTISGPWPKPFTSTTVSQGADFEPLLCLLPLGCRVDR